MTSLVKMLFQISQVKIMLDRTSYTLNTEALEAGIYFVNVSNGISSKTIKFIKL
jgi:hypothetical protein